MNRPIDNPTNQQARAWSAQLGTLAGQEPANPFAMPAHLAAIIAQIRRQRTQEQVEHKIRAHHFIMAD